MSSRTTFTTIRTEGALLPPDILTRIAAADRDLGGLTEASYHLSGEKFGEATNRAWNRLQSAWVGFQSARQSLPPGDAGTTVTRERWLLPLFQLLDFGRLQIAKSQEIGGKTYAISHSWQHVPIHLTGFRVDLDTRANKSSSPHSLLQEFLNRSEDHLWGIVSNGLRLRLLRDNVSLTRQAYVEFDLEAMMSGEAYSDFVLLWLLLHQSRLEGERPELAWIEKWSQAARTEGVRVLDGLSDGVQQAIEALGQGALSHPANAALLEALKNGVLAKQDYYRELLRLVYRLLFLFVAEDRELLLDPNAAPEARVRYNRHYATTRIRSLAVQRIGSRHDDLYRVVKLVMNKLAANGCPELALPALGSFLFSSRSTPHLDGCEIPNRYLLRAFRSLAVTQTKQGRRNVDYKNLGAEELGSVYESLLELYPIVDTTAASFELKVAAGSERKKTGSYYTPSSLISVLMDSAVDPVLAEAARQQDPERAILNLKVLDPACGSGHFLIAAAHRIAKSLASVRSGDEEPAPEAVRHALRDVIGHSIYGVDLNPMAVELCKVSLWMEALEPGKPLSFLEHRIQIGNSLLGTTPRLMSGGIPDEAFQPLEGDTKEACTKWRKVNKSERKAAELKAAKFAFEDYPFIKLGNLAQSLMALDSVGDDTIAGIRAKSEIYEQLVGSGSFLDAKVLADTWCAAFVWRKDSLYDYPITEEVFRRVENNPQTIAPAMRNEVEHLAREYHFFHWHLAFPDVFRVPPPDEEPESPETGWSGGFDIVLGNPPWEHVELKELEWFAARNPEIASAAGADRKRLISALREHDPSLYSAFGEALRVADAAGHFARNSGRYPLCGQGRINTYAIFAENDRSLLAAEGRMGIIVPSGIATDNTTKEFFAALVEANTLASLYDFENAVGMFEGVGHGRFKFCLLTISGSALGKKHAIDFVFFAHHTDDLGEPDRHFTLTADDIELINPNTRTCPIFRSSRDAEITKAIYRRVPVLVNEKTGQNPWGASLRQGLFNMTSDSQLFRTLDQLLEKGFRLHGNAFESEDESYLPLYEAKMMHQFQHRYGDYAMRAEGSLDSELPRIPPARLDDPDYVVQPRYWVPEWEVIKATSRVPASLLKAVELEDEDLARQVLWLWYAGYALNHGRENDAATLLVKGVNRTFQSFTQAISDWAGARSLELQFPLSENDFLTTSRFTTFLESAEYFVYSRVPKWLMAFRDIARSSDERTALLSVLPTVGVNHKAPLLFVSGNPALFLACGNSFVFDYIARQSMGGTSLGFFIFKQIAALPPSAYSDDHDTFIRCRILELTYTAFDVNGFATELGYTGPPFHWNPARRFLLRCELDALFFHLYGISRDDADYIIDTFPIVRRKDQAEYGEYRTKRVILEVFDAIAASPRLEDYQTLLDPGPADPGVAHAVPAAAPPQASPLPAPIPLPQLSLVATGAWATPPGIQPDNFVLLAVTEVLHRLKPQVDPHQVWQATRFVRNPAVAFAFLDETEMKNWTRIIGSEAQPVPKNVIDMSSFRKGTPDQLWGDVIRGMKAVGSLVESGGLWSVTAKALAPADDEWLAGRAEFAVRLAVKLVDEGETELRLAEFLRSVQDGTAKRAVS